MSTKSTQSEQRDSVAVERLVRHWYVCHPDGQDLGLIAPRFDTEAEAIAKRDLWNIDVPGHYVMGITEAPPEFSSLPNSIIEPRAASNTEDIRYADAGPALPAP